MSSNNSTVAIVAATTAAIGASYLLFGKKSKSESRPAGSSVPAKEGDRKYLIGGNWKCNGTLASNEEIVNIFNAAGPIPSNCEVAIAAPYIHLNMLLTKLRDDIAVSAQNCGSNAKDGAYTGEVSAAMIKDIGCEWVIIGHSERREGFGMAGETEELCAQKLKVALDAGLKVMFAIGEKKEQREDGTTMDVCAAQLDPCFSKLTEAEWENVAIAYEPVWAIGTGLTATPEMAQETHAEIRAYMAKKVSTDVAQKIRIQYGGSMKGANAKDLLAQPDIDGGLIGGASLKADFFNVVNGVPM